ncbi:hypothetical protein PR202_ga17859 [Eleusine coracana subsp. coracana]|uniref:Uncharacterized protein n=1 Tax=Eleusine coracana subsp. coracana TaxID=191504 RepID=A0AAV5CR75_ELECO|nr:hypothetical protein PR202_ga17859 [Eleusine coracana subsp. coracana]
MDYYFGAINKVGGRGTVGGGLHALHSLKDLITNCPRFLSAYKTSSCCPFPSSLHTLRLIGVEDMGTLESLSNLTSLTQLTIYYRGKDLRSDGLWDLIMRSQLSWLRVSAGPKFFVGSDPTRGIQDKYQGQLHRSIELELETDDVTGVLIAPICKFLSSFLTELSFNNNEEVKCFTQEQEDSFQLLTSLQKLQFFGCDKLQGLPKSINRLPNLKQLRIDHCPTLNSLPEDGLPRSLRLLILSFCGNEELVQKCINYVKNHPQIAIC